MREAVTDQSLSAASPFCVDAGRLIVRGGRRREGILLQHERVPAEAPEICRDAIVIAAIARDPEIEQPLPRK